jgi:hypothetical protein
MLVKSVDYVDNSVTHAFGAFLNMLEVCPSIFSKAKTIIGIKKEKFDKAERVVFERFLSSFISKNHQTIDQKMLIKMMELSSDAEIIDYSKTPLPMSSITRLSTDYIDFN